MPTTLTTAEARRRLHKAIARVRDWQEAGMAPPATMFSDLTPREQRKAEEIRWPGHWGTYLAPYYVQLEDAKRNPR